MGQGTIGNVPCSMMAAAVTNTLSFNRLSQSLARIAHVHHGDDLLFDEAFFPGVFIRAVTRYQAFYCHFFVLQFCRGF